MCDRKTNLHFIWTRIPMQKMILFINDQRIALTGSFEPPKSNPINSSTAALNDAYKSLNTSVSLEMETDNNFWIAWDLSRQALIEQFQKNNRSLLPGTFIGGLA